MSLTREAAQPIVEAALAHAYDETAFRRLLSNLLGDEALHHRPTVAGNYIWKPYQGHVRQYRHLATYEGPDGEEMDVMAVELVSGDSLDRARTMQRNYIAEHLSRNDRDAALVAFYAEGRDDWRFSFVHLEFRTEKDEDDKLKTVKELTPARRYSFLVGEGEPTHTARGQVLELLMRSRPSIAQIEKAFSVETVTDDFFKAYKDHFITLRDDIDDLLYNRPEVNAEFERCGLTSEAFAKKLLGQIVFLYFVQKKGWLGVPTGAAWGEGPKDFLRKLYNRDYGGYDNFFDDRLEPLFYEALATERGANGYFDQFGCRIPFLNGGLFEPPGGYDWAGVPLRLEDKTFEAVFDTLWASPVEAEG